MADIQQKLQEEKLLKATRARRRFKAAVRNVIHNMYWLDDVADDFDPENTKKTYLLLRKKRPKDGFSIKEKVLLRKHKDYRTQEEIKYLHKFIGGLACFRQYPEDVQLGLVGVTYFEYFGPGRIIIRENDEGHALYCLLTGEVDITKKVWDEITNEYVEEKITTIYPGKMFGEIALLHDVPRTATVTTNAPCELLVLKKDDFDCVLKASLMEKWDSIKDALSKFIYFDEWNSVVIRECCLLSQMKYFSANEIVYGDHKIRKGAVKNTYFIVQGTCKLVEHMYIEEKKVGKGKTHYSIYKLPEDEIEEEIEEKKNNTGILDDEPTQEAEEKLKSVIEEEQATNIEDTFETNTERRSESEPQRESMVETEHENKIRLTITINDTTLSSISERENKKSSKDIRKESRARSHKKSKGSTATETEEKLKSVVEEEHATNIEDSIVAPTEKGSESEPQKGSMVEIETDHENKIKLTAPINAARSTRSRSHKKSQGPSVVPDFIRRATTALHHSHTRSLSPKSDKIHQSLYKKANTVMAIGNLIGSGMKKSVEGLNRGCNDVPENVKLVFMQICTLSERATFFEGDLMNNRRLIAMTPVTVLLIPTYWLVTHNKGNIWKRIERALYHRIPTREEVFKAYKENKEWEDYRKKLRDDILSQKKFLNNTTIHDVPYSIRIMSNYNL